MTVANLVNQRGSTKKWDVDHPVQFKIINAKTCVINHHLCGEFRLLKKEEISISLCD